MDLFIIILLFELGIIFYLLVKDKQKQKLKGNIQELLDEKNQLVKEIQKYNEIYQTEKSNFDKKLKSIDEAKEQYLSTLEDDYINAEQKYNTLIKSYKEETEGIKKELNKMRESLSAGVKAFLREKEKEEKIQFYKLSISDNDLEDLKELELIKAKMHNPSILSKLIWTQYFQRQTTDMCNRVFGEKTVCGIYKITNLITKQCYIGQSVDIQTRIKQHVKAGLGINTSATNRLYRAMNINGVWNFSFELMEECTRDKLNEKEKFWIEMYQTNLYGLNSNGGINN